MTLLTWVGIAFCVSQYAMFSGVNLTFFSVSRLRLEIEATKNNRQEKRILPLRED